MNCNTTHYRANSSSVPGDPTITELDDLLAGSDFISVHVPLLDNTRHLLNEERIGLMKKGARLVHAARGGIVDEAALCAALERGHLAGAALDVFEEEPLPATSPLRRAPNLVLTPHLGASTHEAKHNVSVEMAQQVAVCLKRGIVLNGVNVPRIAPADAAQVGPYLELVHNLAAFLVQSFPGQLQSLRLSVQGGIPESAVRPLTVAMQVGALRSSVEAAVTPVNAERLARERNVRVHAEQVSLKRDFMSLCRVEALVGGERHFASGTVLGNRHGRMVELDGYVLDAIPEPPVLVTFHRDQPGVVGALGTLLGRQGVNIARMQIAAAAGGAGSGGVALGILNLDRSLTDAELRELRALPPIQRACQVV